MMILSRYEKTAKTIIFVFYGVGVLGLSFRYTYPFFIQLIPFALLFSSAILALYHRQQLNPKSLFVFFSIFVASFGIEVVGVNSGLIFGHYTYGQSLGWSILHTPLLIGINWLFLVYTTSSLFSSFKMAKFVRILLASAVMLVYDLVLEHVAPTLDMWTWQGGTIPLQNYAAWFGLAALFHTLVIRFKVNTDNQLSRTILAAQFLFFVALSIRFL